jgi:hypothetical protein
VCWRLQWLMLQRTLLLGHLLLLRLLKWVALQGRRCVLLRLLLLWLLHRLALLQLLL